MKFVQSGIKRIKKLDIKISGSLGVISLVGLICFSIAIGDIAPMAFIVVAGLVSIVLLVTIPEEISWEVSPSKKIFIGEDSQGHYQLYFKKWWGEWFLFNHKGYLPEEKWKDPAELKVAYKDFLGAKRLKEGNVLYPIYKGKA